MHSLTLTSPELTPVRWLTALAVALAGVFVFSLGLKLSSTQCSFRFGCHVGGDNLKHLSIYVYHLENNLNLCYIYHKCTP